MRFQACVSNSLRAFAPCALCVAFLVLWTCTLGTAEPQAPAPAAAKQPSSATLDPTLLSPLAWLPPPTDVPNSKATTEAEMKPYTERISNTDVTFDMVPIPGGKFTMGSPPTEKGREECEGPQFEAIVEPFWMGKCEVTWQEYELWGLGTDIFLREGTGRKATELDKLADAISRPTPPYEDMSFNMGKDGRPAICMSQFAAKVYCKWLSAKTGRYYRLPTEAEWEYACRAQTKTAYSFGDDPAPIGEYAWYALNSDEKYGKVCQKKPNPWGLYDMHGNVCEWVLDRYTAEGYKEWAGLSVVKPLAIPATIYKRVVRGGSYADEPGLHRSASRVYSDPSWNDRDPQFPQSVWYLTDASFVGFRVVRPLKVPSPEEAARYDVDEVQRKDFLAYKKAKGL